MRENLKRLSFTLLEAEKKLLPAENTHKQTF